MSEHTPGPWDACDPELWGRSLENVLITSEVEGEETPDEVCEVIGHNEANVRDANVRLITAAPDLLAACELLLAVYAPLYFPAEVSDAFSSAVIKARAAISKAKGK